MAGIRVGYALRSLPMAAKLREPVGAGQSRRRPAPRCVDSKERSLREIIVQRERLASDLARVGIAVSASSANFASAELPGKPEDMERLPTALV